MIARVSGNLSRKVVLWPGRVSRSTEPFSRYNTVWTTSRPTPRPETSVISSAVLKPGLNMSARMPDSPNRSASSAVMSPFSRAFDLIL